MSNLSRLMLLVIVATLAATPANADSVKFYSGTTGYTGIFSGAGSVYSNTFNQLQSCPGGGLGGCGSTDVVSTPQSYTASSNITASSSTSAVWADLSPNFAGLGVGNGSPSDDDQILNGDILTIKFDTSVQLKGVGTLFDAGHNPFGAFNADQITGAMGIIINGVFHSLLSANFDALVGLGLVGDTFTFQWAGVGNPGFYVSALDYTKGAITQTPLPPAALLFGTALAGLGILGRRRRKDGSALAQV